MTLMLPPSEVFFVTLDRQGGRPRKPPYHRLYLKYPQAKMYFDYYTNLPAELHRLDVSDYDCINARLSK